MKTSTIDLTGESMYGWVKAVKRFWESVLHLLYFVVTSTADYAVEIAARAIAIAAPLPNAISVHKISQEELGFTPIAALAFAIVIEVAVFALVEFSLHLFDGWLRNPKKWAIPFGLSVVSVVVGVSVVAGFVYNIEVVGKGHTIMAWPPVISLCAFMSIGLKRWHDRQSEITGIKTVKPKAKPEVSAEIAGKKGASVEKMNEAKAEKIRKRKQEISNVISENGPLGLSEISRLLPSKISDKTLASDLKSMTDEGTVTKAGRKWSIIATRLPVLSAPVLNGSGKH